MIPRFKHRYLKPVLAFGLILSLSVTAFAQHSLKGRVINEQGEPLTYANVVLLSPADSTLQYHDIVDQKGLYQIEHIKAGAYLMQFSFVGMAVIYENITVPPEQGENLGDKVLKANALLDEMVVTAEYVPIEIEQDTVSFNAKAFKVEAGAAVEDLLKKMPGIEVDKTGNVKALGEDVTRVLVDGKEFFGNDPKLATKNLPADAIDKVQVYDKKTDEAEFTGIDDGVRDRTINLLLNEDKKKGYFGNAAAGGGTGSHYNTQAKLYRFSSTIQSALLGMYNNVNEFRFTGKDDASWGRKISGLNTTVAGGLNLSYNAEKRNRYFSLSLQRSSGNGQFNMTLGTSWRQFDKVQDNRSVGKSDYFHFLPRLSYSNNYREGRRTLLRYNSSINMPATGQLLPVANTTNRLSIYQGNLNSETREVRYHVGGIDQCDRC